MEERIAWIPGPWPGRLGIARRPRGGDWLDHDVEAWRDAGIDVVVSLLERAEESELSLTREADACRARGLDHRSLPVPDLGVPPSREAVASLAGDLVDALRAGKVVALHCRQGLGRSPLVAAATLVAAGESAEDAMGVVGRARGAEIPETPAQRRWILDFASWLATPRRESRSP